MFKPLSLVKNNIAYMICTLQFGPPWAAILEAYPPLLSWPVKQKLFTFAMKVSIIFLFVNVNKDRFLLIFQL